MNYIMKFIIILTHPHNKYKPKKETLSEMKTNACRDNFPRPVKQGKNNSAILLQHPYILCQFTNYIILISQLLCCILILSFS